MPSRPRRALARNSFWLAYTNPNRSALDLMTPEFRQFVGKRCTNGCLVLHVRRDEFTQLVTRWKEDFPALKILRYARVQRISDSRLVGGSFFQMANEHSGEWCVLVSGTPNPRIDEHGYMWMDITNEAFRAAIVTHLAEEVRTSGCDGLAIDSHHWDLQGPETAENGDALNAAWQAGAIAFLEEMKSELGAGFTVIFNGLWGFEEHLPVKQGEMVPSADGVAVEFFGVDGHVGDLATPDVEWPWFVENLNTQLSTVGIGKFVNVNSQRLSEYANYADDYATALYCYG